MAMDIDDITHYEHLLKYKAEIAARYDALRERAYAFISEMGFEESAFVSDKHLREMVLDYFSDIDRTKQFHPIPRVNKVRIISYTVAWWLKRKVIQINRDVDKTVGAFLNERFMTHYIDQELREAFPEAANYVFAENGMYDVFYNHLYYHLKYRSTDVQALELVLISFLAGAYIVTGQNYSDIVFTEEELYTSDVESVF
jgi:hypothetical protein